jgi:hypothetical protein
MRKVLGSLAATLVVMLAVVLNAASVIAATAIEYGLIAA